MTRAKTVNIHGKEYVPVSERVRIAHEELKEMSIATEVLKDDPIVVIRATVRTPRGTFTGISSSNPAKLIEKTNPYEVAETSAVGRALGFAGFGMVDSIATADEVVKSEQAQATPAPATTPPASEPQRKLLFALGQELGHDGEETKEIIKKHYGLGSFTELTFNQASQLIPILQDKVKALPKETATEPVVSVNPNDIPF